VGRPSARSAASLRSWPRPRDGVNLDAEKALPFGLSWKEVSPSQRINGIDINTLIKLLARAGPKRGKIMPTLTVNVNAADLQADPRSKSEPVWYIDRGT
jgi:hypothetical protein